MHRYVFALHVLLYIRVYGYAQNNREINKSLFGFETLCISASTSNEIIYNEWTTLAKTKFVKAG